MTASRGIAAVGTVEVAGGLKAIELGTSYPNDQALHAFTPTCAMPSHPGGMLRLVLRVIRVRVRLDLVMRHAFDLGRHVMRHASVTSSL